MRFSSRQMIYYCLLLIASAILVGCSAPPATSGGAQPTSLPAAEPPGSSAPTQEPEPTQATSPTQAPAIPEERWITVEWPPDIKVGDSDVIRLTLDVNQQGYLTPTALVQGHETTGEAVSIPNLYETHNVSVEARLDLAGVEVQPAEEVSEPLNPGEPVTFQWSLRPSEVGTFRGTIWLHLRFIPKEGGQESRKSLTAQLVEVRAVNFLGLGGTTARLLGGLGTLVGSFLGLDSILSWAVGLIKRRLKSG
jgi:hypothetical protein